MILLSFPDVNVWLALMLADHVHREAAKQWWLADQSEAIGFSRFTQISVLRLLTTAAAMNGKPLNMRAAWRAYDSLFEDSRVCMFPEPTELEPGFRRLSSSKMASPKVWADAYLLAFAVKSNATIVTFDKALASRNSNSVLLRSLTD